MRLYKFIRIYLAYRRVFKDAAMRGENYTWKVPVQIAWNFSRF